MLWDVVIQLRNFKSLNRDLPSRFTHRFMRNLLDLISFNFFNFKYTNKFLWKQTSKINIKIIIIKIITFFCVHFVAYLIDAFGACASNFWTLAITFWRVASQIFLKRSQSFYGFLFFKIFSAKALAFFLLLNDFSLFSNHFIIRAKVLRHFFLRIVFCVLLLRRHVFFFFENCLVWEF